MDQQAYKPLSYPVKLVQNRTQDFDPKQKIRWGQFAIEGYQDLHIYHDTSIKTAYLPVVNGVANIPNDCVQWCFVGIDICGQLWSLAYNPNLGIPPLPECGLTPREACNCAMQNPESGAIPLQPSERLSFIGHYWGDTYIEALYGIGGGFGKNYYNIDEDLNRIVLNADFPCSHIVLQYKSTGIHLGTLIPFLAAKPVMAHILKLEYDFGNYSQGDKQKMSMERDQAYYQYEINKLVPTMEQIIENIFHSAKQVHGLSGLR